MISPADLKVQYDIPANLDGTGQIVAVIEGPGRGDVAADLNTFSRQFGLPECDLANPCFEHVDLSNGAPIVIADDYGLERSLDTQIIHGVAPAAKIILVTAASFSTADYMAAANYAAALPGVTVVSMSFEDSSFPLQDQLTQDQAFANFVANGMTFIASSGDGGYWFTTSTYPAPGFPANSPYVTVVGGTKINAVHRDDLNSPETAWALSGGGYSIYAPMPSWQLNALDANTIAANHNMRAYPDVAALADATSAFGTYYQGGWRIGNGTSAAAPFWAGIHALLGQYLASKSISLTGLVASTPGGFNALLYRSQLRQAANSSFYDITLGSNNPHSVPCNICVAKQGFDNVTGWGSPNVANLLANF